MSDSSSSLRNECSIRSELPAGEQRKETQTHTKERRRLPYRLTLEDFTALTSEDDRALLRRRLSHTISSFLETGCAVYLDGVGVLFPRQETAPRAHVHGDRLIVRRETVVTPDFEKSAELLSMHFEKFRPVVEAKELADRIYPSLPLTQQLRWSASDVRSLLRGLMLQLKYETVTCGRSELLHELGTFYALHNRHGSTTEDWFAGADVFFRSEVEMVTRVEQATVLERPNLASTLELFEAAYGPAKRIFEDSAVRVAVFERPVGDQHVFVYVTDGLRSARLGFEGAEHAELVIQLSLPLEIEDGERYPAWPAELLQRAGTALVGAENGIAAISSGPVAELLSKHTSLHGLLPTTLQHAPHEQRSGESAFRFVNLVGITQEELELAHRVSTEHLIALLWRKGLNQLTRPKRSSVTARTSVAEPEPARRAPSARLH